MQLLFLADLGSEAQQIVQELSKVPSITSSSSFILVLGLTLLIAVVSCWIASQLVTKENNGVGTAIGTAIRYSISAAAIALLAGGGMWVAARQGSGAMLKASAGIGAVLALYAGVSIPIKNYKINAAKGFAFMFVAILVQAAAHVASARIMSDPLQLGTRITLVRRMLALEPAELASVMEKVRSVSTPSPALATPKPEKSIAERETELKRTYADLMDRRLKLTQDDQAGLESYTKDTERYVETLTRLRSDAAAAERAGK